MRYANCLVLALGLSASALSFATDKDPAKPKEKSTISVVSTVEKIGGAPEIAKSHDKSTSKPASVDDTPRKNLPKPDQDLLLALKDSLSTAVNKLEIGYAQRIEGLQAELKEIQKKLADVAQEKDTVTARVGRRDQEIVKLREKLEISERTLQRELAALKGAAQLLDIASKEPSAVAASKVTES